MILCYNYISKQEFYNCIELCIENSEGFNESEYQRIRQSILAQDQNQDNSEGFNESEYHRIRQSILTRDHINNVDRSNSLRNTEIGIGI